ncbi:heat shock protein [Nymphaea thermarum]|nr:heat shock protein [Nymphaea thermarum]
MKPSLITQGPYLRIAHIQANGANEGEREKAEKNGLADGGAAADVDTQPAAERPGRDGEAAERAHPQLRARHQGQQQQQHKEKEEAEVKYLRMERRVGKFMRKFNLPKNANADAISAEYRDGVLTVTVQKLPPPEPKKPKTIEVKVA